MRKIVKAISTIDELDIDLFKNLNIGVEIQDFTEPNLRDVELENLLVSYGALLENFKGIKSLHGPFLDLKPASPDLKIREVSYKRYLDTLKTAEKLAIDYVIFHSQINPYINIPSLKSLNNKQAKEMWENLLVETDFKGIILIENVFEEGPSMMKEYMETLELNNIRVNLDIGHARLGRSSLEEWISELKDFISYIHVHSNDRQYDRHEIPSVYEIENLYYLLDKYKINPVLSLEYKARNLKEEIKKYFS